LVKRESSPDFLFVFAGKTYSLIEGIVFSRGGIMNYGFFKFILDVTLTCLTGGLWLIWIFIREMRRRNTIVIG